MYYEHEGEYKTLGELKNAIEDYIACYNEKKNQGQTKRRDSFISKRARPIIRIKF